MPIKTYVRILLMVVVVLLGTTIGFYRWMRTYVVSPGASDAVVMIDVKPGDTLRPILRKLHKRGVLQHPDVLYVWARLSHKTTVRSGEYEIHGEQTPQAILTALVLGQVRLHSIVLPEGLNRFQIRAILTESAWMTALQFDTLCDDQALLLAEGLPGPTCEGYLFPETYKFVKGVAPKIMFATMYAAYKRALAEATAHGFGPMHLSILQFTTLASLVEKETAAAEERPHIACVFYNRLQARPMWRLETDPTVIYAATLQNPHFDGNLRRTHLHGLDSPYNTYRIYGLPKGPIANPGRAALFAVAHPDTCGDYFFVSNNQGRHIFCPTLQCHNTAVKKWQIDYFRSVKHGMQSTDTVK